MTLNEKVFKYLQATNQTNCKCIVLNEKGKGKGKWCVAKYGDPYSEFVLCI